jgi:serine/threonine-protein kinase
MPATLLLPQQRVEQEGAQRMMWLAVAAGIAIVTAIPLYGFTQPQLGPVIADPLVRLCALFVVLAAGGFVALRRLEVVKPKVLLQAGMAFEILVAFAIAMFETCRPPAVPVLGLSGIGPWIVMTAALLPTVPSARLALALAAATMWPVAYWINSSRLGFDGLSWRQAVWPVGNYLFVVVAYLVGRLAYRTALEHANLINRAAFGSIGNGDASKALGSYELLTPIAEGGMGEIWEARHKMLARPAAIKIVKPDPARQDVFAQRFHREANAIAALQSPHTIYLYDFGTTQEGRLYYVMELLDGISVQRLVNDFGAQPPSRVVSILRQICLSLDEAHEKKIVHRDLKPSNVMICRVARTHDFVKVLDFGLAKPFGAEGLASLTVEGMSLGTPEYMAPEMIRGESVGTRADLYALGCIGYVLLTGTVVFVDSNPVTLALKHLNTRPEPPSARVPHDLPSDLERIVLQCLEKDPSARPATARDVERRLAACKIEPWTDADAADWWQRHLPAHKAR